MDNGYLLTPSGIYPKTPAMTIGCTPRRPLSRLEIDTHTLNRVRTGFHVVRKLLDQGAYQAATEVTRSLEAELLRGVTIVLP